MQRGWLAKLAVVLVVAGGLAWFVAANQTHSAGTYCAVYVGSGFTKELVPPARLVAAQARMVAWLRAEGFKLVTPENESAWLLGKLEGPRSQLVKSMPDACQWWSGHPAGAGRVYVVLTQRDLSNPTAQEGLSQMYEFNAWVVWQYRGLVWPVRRASTGAEAFAGQLMKWWREQPALLGAEAVTPTIPAASSTAPSTSAPASTAASPVSNARL